jgi:Phage portal protein, SPP1 Gp6-like.
VFLTLQDAIQETDRLQRELDNRRPEISKRIQYFKGETGQLRFASEKFGQYFDRQYTGFSDNWCMPVAQAPAERMNLLGLRPYGRATGVDSEIERAWYGNDADAGSSEAFLIFGVASRSFSLVHPSGQGPDGLPAITWEHPETAIVDTDPMTRQDRAGLVVWADDKVDYATLYTPEQVFRFKRKTAQERFERQDVPVRGGGWELRDPDVVYEPNPLGEVPLTELQNQTLLDDKPISDISGVMALQDSINLIWAYLLNALDQASLAARVVTGAELPKTPILNKDGQVIGTQDVELDELMKERILWIPGSEVDIKEWSAANLEAFSGVIERIVEHIAAQTRTPPHYLVAKMINTAAESLNIAEAGLVSKTQERIRYASRGMRKTMRLIAKAQGADQRRLHAISAGQLIWANVQYRSEAQMADVAVKLKSSGFPLEYIAEKLVVDPSEVRRIMKMHRAELAADPLAAAQQAMNQGFG